MILGESPYMIISLGAYSAKVERYPQTFVSLPGGSLKASLIQCVVDMLPSYSVLRDRDSAPWPDGVQGKRGIRV